MRPSIIHFVDLADRRIVAWHIRIAQIGCPSENRDRSQEKPNKIHRIGFPNSGYVQINITHT